MGKKVLLIIGITMVFTSLFMIAEDGEESREKVITEDYIIQRAKGIGMTFPGEEYRRGINLESRVSLEEAFLGFEGQQEKEDKTVAEEKNIEEETIINKAKELGMVFVDDNVEEKVELESDKEFEISITIPEGIAGRDIATILYANGLIEDRMDFILLSDKLGVDSKIMAGDYIFEKGISPLRVLLEMTAK
ncbi:hypothetical protein [Halonatronum saccharophilum]|uniref:hypothetical protein n=1 Tax=Halonatronum saccharophilum TaxID=150060 RepID=UPI00047FB32D|nr:hypothetical protein [Halonatronum saccharophilum]